MKLGCDDLQTANDTLRTGLIFALVTIGIAGALVYLFAPELVRLMGANDVLQNDAVTFIRVLAPFFSVPRRDVPVRRRSEVGRPPDLCHHRMSAMDHLQRRP